MIRFIRLLTLLALSLIAAACNGEVVVGGQRPARLLVVSGDLQTDTVGKELAQPLVVRVVDDKERPVRNQLVNFVVTAGGGSVFAGAALTNADGEARERWTLGPVAGDTQRVEARAVDAATGQAIVFATFRAVGVADAPASAVIVGAPTRAGAAGTVIADSLVVKVADRYGNPAAGVPVTFAAQNGGSVAPATATTRADGTARSQWMLGGASGAQTATATAAGFPALTFTATVATGAVARVVLTPESIRFNALGQTLPMTVQVFDAFGNPVGGVPVMVVSQNAAIAALDSGPTARAAGNGTTRLVATVNGSTAADSTTVVVQQIAATLVATPARGSLIAGETLQLGASAFDVRGNPLLGAPLRFTSSGPALSVSASGLVTATSAGVDSIRVYTDSALAWVRIQVSPTVQAAQLAAGPAHSCAVTGSGQAYCWGGNADGALGVPSSLSSSLVPVAVQTGVRFTRIDTSDRSIVQPAAHTCAIATDASAWCWGADDRGQLGAPGGGSSIPLRVDGGSWTRITTGAGFTCGISGGLAYCWGRLGSVSRSTPGQSSDIPFVEIEAGAAHVCALTPAGEAWCWGSNLSSQLGTTLPFRVTFSDTPIRVQGGHTFVRLSAGASRTCGITAAGAMYCWGEMIGPVPVQFAGTYQRVAVGATHSCALTTSGEARCRGANFAGQLGNGFSDGSGHDTFEPVVGGFTYSQISVGDQHTCAVRASDDATLCWGRNSLLGAGQLPEPDYRAVPVLVRSPATD